MGCGDVGSVLASELAEQPTLVARSKTMTADNSLLIIWHKIRVAAQGARRETASSSLH